MVHGFITNTKAAAFYNAEKYEKLLLCCRWYFRRFSRRLCHGNVLIINEQKKIYIHVYAYIVHCSLF